MKPILAPKAPKALGPYSAAIQHGGLVFLSGQTPIDPVSGELVPGGISEQSEQCLKNISAVLEAAGINLNHIVKTTCFLTDMADFAAFNKVYGCYFTDNKPARSTVGVKALPKGASVEIECIAALES